MKIGSGWWLAALAAGALSGIAAPADRPSRMELQGARHRLENFEKQVERARGQPLRLGTDATEALERIKTLKEQFPGDPEVEALFQRARKALVASKGQTAEVGGDVLAYRHNEQKLKQAFADIAAREWADLQARFAAATNLLAAPWPPPDYEEQIPDDLVGRLVVLDEFSYPANQFRDTEKDYVYVGSPSRGYYFVDIHGRAWSGAYEAFKRYRRQVNRDIPENAPWILAGRITGLALMIPEAAKEKTRGAVHGWTVEPVALYVPGCTVGVADPSAPAGGYFSGEASLEELKRGFYTVTEIPADVTPDRLVEIFSIAIKEKNYPLYLDCIDPRRRMTPKALDLCAYHWDWHQRRFATLYALVRVEKPSIRVVQGYDENAKTEAFFLSEEEKKAIQAHASERVEEAAVRTRVYDEKGRQYGSPKTFFLRRVGNGRWHIATYAQPF